MGKNEDHHHGHGHDHHGHGHGNHHDQGPKAMLRYLKNAKKMWRSDLNDAVVADIAPRAGQRVVDVGAGVGAGVVVAARSGADVVAVEPTDYMRRVLKLRRLVSRGRSHIEVVAGAAEALHQAPGSVDAVWAVNTMHHWNAPDVAAVEIERVLRPGGRMLLADEDFDDPTHPYAAKRAKQAERQGHHPFSMVDAEAMGKHFSDAGLVEVRAEKRQMAGCPVIVVTARKA